MRFILRNNSFLTISQLSGLILSIITIFEKKTKKKSISLKSPPIPPLNHLRGKMYQIWQMNFCKKILEKILSGNLLLKLSYKNAWVKFHASSRFFTQWRMQMFSMNCDILTGRSTDVIYALILYSCNWDVLNLGIFIHNSEIFF